MFEVVPTLNGIDILIFTCYRNRIMRTQKIKFLRFELHILVFEDLKDSEKNLHFQFGLVPI